MASPDPYDVAGLLRVLTRRLTAALEPMAGAGWQCQRVLPRIDGTAAVDIVGPDFEATYNWVAPPPPSTEPRPQQTDWLWGALDLPEGAGPTPVTRELARLLSTTLARTLAHPAFAVLRFCNRQQRVLQYDDNVVDRLLAHRLGPDHTRWFDHVFQDAFQDDANRFQLAFTGPQGDLTLGVTAPGVDLSDGERLFRHPLFALWLLQDPRPPDNRQQVRAQVERFIGFLLCRGVHSEMTLQTMGLPTPGQDPDSAVVTSWKDAPVSTSRWGNPEQWYQFFSDFEIARSGLCNVQFTEAVAYVLHGERECCQVEPHVSPRPHVYARLPFAPAPLDPTVRQAQSRKFVSLITERETVLGGDDSLASALDAAIADPHTRLIHINNTCLPKMVGDDLESQVARLAARTDKSILNLNTDLDSPDASYRHMLVQAERQGREKLGTPEVVDNTVSFLGYGPGPHRRELEQCLQAIDAGIAVFLLPELDVERAWRYRGGGAQIVYPQQIWQTLHTELFADLETPVLRAPAPYGLRDTRQWLQVIATALDRLELFEERWPTAVVEHEEKLDALRAQVAGRRAGAVVTPASASRLFRAERLYGVRLLPLLEELGFGLDVLMMATDPDAVAEAEAELRGCLDHGDRLTLHPFTSPDELTECLAQAPCELVYSEVACDQRLSRAGKTGFGLDLLEMGPTGAVRSLERLLAAARWPFYRRFAEQLRPSEPTPPAAEDPRD